MHSSSSFLRGLAATAALVSAWLSTGCQPGSDAPELSGAAAGHVSLLERQPSFYAVDLGAIQPAAGEGWGEFTAGGWIHRAAEHLGVLGVQADLREASLRLPAASSKDRELVIRAALPAEETRAVVVELNGVEMGRFEPAAEWEEHRIPTPSSAWGTGTNLLTFKQPGFKQSDPRLVVAAVQYDDTAHPGFDAGAAVQLGPEEACTYDIAGAWGQTLALQADGNEELGLLVRMRPIDVRGARRDGEWLVEERFDHFDLKDGVELSLPEAEQMMAQLELTGLGQGSERLRLNRLELSGTAPTNPLGIKRPELVVFLSVDTLSAPHMSLYGYGRKTTPELEAWSREAIVFEHCTTNAPWTVPSYLSQFTGLLPESSRIDTEEGKGLGTTSWDRYQLAGSRVSMAEMMRGVGYRTVGIVDNHWLTKIPGVRQGFDHFDTEPAEVSINNIEGGMRMVFRKAREELAAWDREQPLFLFLQILDVHGPYMTNAPWEGTFQSEDPGPLVPVVTNWNQSTGTVQQYLVDAHLAPGEELPEAVHVNPLNDAYDAKVLEMDAFVGELLLDLKAGGYLEDGLVVLSADHGESTLDRDFFFRHKSAYEPTTHVPLAIRLPGGLNGGRRVAGNVQLVDLYPTFADLLGLPFERENLHGQSLVPALKGAELKPRPAVVETDFMEQRAVIHDGWKLVVTRPWEAKSFEEMLTVPRIWDLWAAEFPEYAEELAGSSDVSRPPIFNLDRFNAFKKRNPGARGKANRYLLEQGPLMELYDLASDPDEEVDLSGSRPDKIAELLQIGVEAALMTSVARDEVRGQQVELRLSDDSRKELEQLGYLEAGSE